MAGQAAPILQAGSSQVRSLVAGQTTHPSRCQSCQAAILILLRGGGPWAIRLSNAASAAEQQLRATIPQAL